MLTLLYDLRCGLITLRKKKVKVRYQICIQVLRLTVYVPVKFAIAQKAEIKLTFIRNQEIFNAAEEPLLSK